MKEKLRNFFNKPIVPAVLGSTCLLLIVMGILNENASQSRLFDFDRELNAIAFFSSSLLIFTGFFLWDVGKSIASGSRIILILAAIFLFMGFDEFLKIHETLEKLSGINWQILYLPIILLAGIGWFRVLLCDGVSNRFFWILGATCWAVSQLLEAAQWTWGEDEKASNYDTLMVIEESLEMLGSYFFVLVVWRISRKLALLPPIGVEDVQNDVSPPGLLTQSAHEVR